MAKNKLLENLYSEYVGIYNDFKKDDPLTGNTMSDVGFYLIDHRQLEEFASGGHEDYFDEYDLWPCSNLVISTNYKGKLYTVIEILCKDETGKHYRYTSEDEPNDSNENVSMFAKDFSEYLIQALKKKETLLGRTDIEAKTRAGQEKIIPLIYVTSKRYLAASKKQHPNIMNWKHSWEVVGHWRKVDFVGKNKDGDYGEIGRTWVKPCVKGDGELIKKIRIAVDRKAKALK